MDSDVPDESRFMPPPIARSSMSKPTKTKPSKPPRSKHPKSKPQIPKTTRKTRSQTANESTTTTTTNESLLSDEHECELCEKIFYHAQNHKVLFCIGSNL